MTATLTGYADRISVRAGETVAFKISSHGTGPFSASLVRIVCGDPNPAGTGPMFEDQSGIFAGRYPSKVQHARARLLRNRRRPGRSACRRLVAVEALIWPTLPTDGPQTVISRRDPATGAGFALVMTPDGMTLEAGDARVSVGKPLRAHTWYRVWASADTSTGMLRVGQQPLKRAFATDDEGDASLTAPTVVVEAAQPILIGAEAAKDRPAHRCFNGKIEAPAIAGIAAWDFSRRMELLDVEDTGPNGLHGRLVNLPTRAMKGASWTGAERDWKKAPHQYARDPFPRRRPARLRLGRQLQLHRAGRT